MSGPHLVDRLRQIVADVEKLTLESEDRLAFRQAHERDLSAAHKAALQDLRGALEGLRDRIDVLVAPPVDVGALKAEFDALVARLRTEQES